MSIIELRFSDEGRVVIGCDDPLYKSLSLRPSPETIAKLERIEQANAAGFLAVRDMLFGGARQHLGEHSGG